MQEKQYQVWVNENEKKFPEGQKTYLLMRKIILMFLVFISLVMCNRCGKKNIKVLTGYFVRSNNTSITVDIYESNYISATKITNEMSNCQDYAKAAYWDDKHYYMTGFYDTGPLKDTLCFKFLLDKNYNVLKGTDSLKEIAYTLYIPQISYRSNGRDNYIVREFVETMDGNAKTKRIGIKRLYYR